MYAKLQTSLPLLAFKFSCNSRNSSYELLRFSNSSDADGRSKVVTFDHCSGFRLGNVQSASGRASRIKQRRRNKC